MARKPRLLLDGGYYHIVTRGNNKMTIFRDEKDYRLFRKIIRQYLAKLDISILHYCLMPTHIHLLIQAIVAKDMPKFMQEALQVYSSYFRKTYAFVGHVFQNRYKSLLIQKDSYLLECGRYIERNPLRANLVQNLFDYPWSSFSYYAKGKEDGIIKNKEAFYFKFCNIDPSNRQAYIDYILQERPYEQILDKQFKI